MNEATKLYEIQVNKKSRKREEEANKMPERERGEQKTRVTNTPHANRRTAAATALPQRNEQR